MAKSIAEKVQDFINKNPDCTNQDLYTKFPKVRPNTLRHYKSKFAHQPEDAKEGSKTQAKATLASRMTELEARVQTLESKQGFKNIFDGKKPLA
ncbi:MAG: hypothetical protein QNL04_03360, partial [SAR324 cluster bacterium]|nr:hypothetical protein [SAR324 cluster bacterium]